MIITVTGLIGSGKTSAAEFFYDLIRANVIHVDDIGHAVLHGKAKSKIVSAFGKDILKGRSIDAEKLATLVFSSRAKLKKLHALTHPHMIREIKRRIKKNKVNVIDAALYTEFDLHKMSDYTVVVTCSKATRVRRLKGTHSRADINNRERFQTLPKKPDFLIDNNGTAAQLKGDVRWIWEEIQIEQGMRR